MRESLSSRRRRQCKVRGAAGAAEAGEASPEEAVHDSEPAELAPSARDLCASEPASARV